MPDQLPEGFLPDPEDILRFVTAVVEATAEFAAAYKPNSAFYEALGPPGMEVLQAVIAAVPSGIPVILDVKRGDIGHTATRYADAAFGVYGAAAVTVHSYLGRDSVEPFLAWPDRGVFIVCRTSNPGAVDVEDLAAGGRPLYLEVARLAREWDDHGGVGLVCGATYPEEMAGVRAECPGMPILVPGVGAQGGDTTAAAQAAAGMQRRDPFVISASRSIAHAGNGHDFQHAAAQAAQRLRQEIEDALV